MDVITEPCY